MEKNMTHRNIPVKHSVEKYSCEALVSARAESDHAVMENLKRIRNERGLSQVQLAEAVGCSQSLISKLETGGKNVTLSQIEAIAAVLQCEPWELFGIDAFRQKYLQALMAAPPERREAVLLLLGATPA